jgi:hypothetical protein
VNTAVKFQVLTAASMMFRVVFWVIRPGKNIFDPRFRGAYCLHHQRSGSITQKTTLNMITLISKYLHCKAECQFRVKSTYSTYSSARSVNTLEH